MAGATVARTPHFALHRLVLPTPQLQPLADVELQDASSDSEPRTAPEAVRAQWPLFAVPASQPAGNWLGAMVPKRWARRAVTRNAIKRQIYTVAADFDARLLPPAAHVVRLRSAFDRTQYPSATSDALKTAVRGELQQLFGRATAAVATAAASAVRTTA